MNVKTVFVWAGFCVMSCTNHEKADTLLVKGNIENLPDGKMYLSEWGRRIDSTETRNGKFAFEMNKGDNFEPKYVEFLHVAHSDSMVRVFMFDSKAKYKSKPLNSSWSNPLFPGHGFYKLVQVNILRIIYFLVVSLVMRGYFQA